ncbi:MAG TPA: DUF6356 family protein [Alphaproteobacteria bacterium]|jgi:hypothetical protein
MTQDVLALKRLFTAHPAAIGEGYFDHLLTAIDIGARMIAGGFACLVHAVLPFVFTTTGSETIAALSREIEVRRSRATATDRRRTDPTLRREPYLIRAGIRSEAA